MFCQTYLNAENYSMILARTDKPDKPDKPHEPDEPDKPVG